MQILQNNMHLKQLRLHKKNRLSKKGMMLGGERENGMQKIIELKKKLLSKKPKEIKRDMMNLSNNKNYKHNIKVILSIKLSRVELLQKCLSYVFVHLKIK